MAAMKRIVKIGALAAVGLVVVVAALAAGAVWLGERKAQRAVLVKVVPVPYASGPAALKQGKYLFESRGCAECHGPGGGGRVVVNDPGGGMFVKAPNITAGGVVAQYGEADWVRAIRHGVDPRGRPLQVMPSEDYNRLTDADLAALVAYVRSLPPAPPATAEIRFPVIVKALYGLGVIPDAAGRINHALPPSQPVAVGATVEHGDYVARMCTGCHGEHLGGGKIPGGPPQWPAAANLTPGEGTVMTRYDTPEKFIAMMRSGKRPDGTAVDKAMPFETLGAMNDTDLNAVYAYLKTVAPRAMGAR
jgi:mono/diheme cytochrome c family protein